MQIKTYYEVVKATLFGLIIVALVIAGLKGYAWINIQFAHQEAKFELNMEAQRQRLELEINQVRAHTQIVTAGSEVWKAEMKKLRKESMAIVELVKKNDEKIKNVGEISAKVNENLSRDLRKMSDHVYKEGTGDPNEQYFKKIYMKEKDKDGNIVEIPAAWVIYSPNKPKEDRWKMGVYPIEYKTKIIQSEQKDGQYNTQLETWAENNKDKDSRGKKLPLKIEVAEFIQLRKEDKEFFWWAPHLSFNVDFGISDFDTGSMIVPGISFSTSGYGRTKNDLDWKLVSLGIASTGDNTYFRFSPFSWNIGNAWSFVSHTYISPFVGFSIEGDTILGIGLDITF